jgi:uncharacterized protein (TIGR04255 family)
MSEQSVFEPIGDAHALVEWAVLMSFSVPLTSEMSRVLELQYELKDDFPRAEVMRGFHVSIEPHGQSFSETQNGLELKRFKPNGDLDWLIRITPEAISIHCLSYTRWAEVWPRANGYLKAIFRRIGTAETSIASLGQKYIDRFNYAGDIDNYDARTLISASSPYINPKSLTVGPRWHCHTGWFDQPGSGAEAVLHQLNIDSAFNLVGGMQKVVVTIDNNLILTAATPDELSNMAKFAASDEELGKLMEALHIANKGILRDLLTVEMQERIKLGSDDGSGA